MQKISLIVVLFLALAGPASAQFYPTQYRPAHLDWQQLRTDHFRIVFPAGEDSAAYETGRILEAQYKDVQNLVGGSLSDFPVVLNNYNDMSNGYVTPYHFRMEVEIPTIKGKSLNPQSGDWMQTVMPHELVHALHLSETPPLSIPGLLKPFAPDMVRSFHSAVPSGVLEGIAVEHETEGVSRYGGRGQYPYFTGQFDAVFNSDSRWSMGQMVHISADSRPFNRHYIGGYEFTHWLQDNYGEDATKDAIRFYAAWPFLGYGIALKHSTGLYPAQLYHRFEDDLKKEEQKKLAAHKDRGWTPLHLLAIPKKGASIRRPKFISDKKILFYGSFYNDRPGFFSYNLGQHRMKRQLETYMVEDYRYDLSQDGHTLLYARYVPDPIYSHTFKSDMYRLNLQTGQEQRLTKNKRVFSPFFAGSRINALQTDDQSTRLVKLSGENNSIEPILAPKNGKIIAVASNPVHPEQIAVVANMRGKQGLWITTMARINSISEQDPTIIFEKGSIFDPVWHPKGDRLLFTSDYSGMDNIYEYHLNGDSLNQVTNSRYNAFEASYSPGGDRIVYIHQEGNQQLPATLSRSEFYGEKIDKALWHNPSGALANELGTDHTGQKGTNGTSHRWERSSYGSRTGWLKPRAMLPYIDSEKGQYGVSLLSGDLLRQNAYNLQLSAGHRRLWYDFSYKHTGFYPGFRTTFYNKPIVTTSQEAIEERGISLGIPIPITLEQNTRTTFLRLRPQLKAAQLRAFDPGQGSALSPYSYRYTLNFTTTLYYRLQQNIRDVQPNTGWMLFTETNRDLFAKTRRSQDYPYYVPVGTKSAFRAGIYKYLSPLRRYNQSLRIGAEVITQSKNAFFDIQSLVSPGFDGDVLTGKNNILSLGTRYTVPIWYPDDGGFLIPAYLSNVYLVGFTNTVGDLSDSSFSKFYTNSRTIFGAGLRTTFRISNLTLDIGVALALEPTRNNLNAFIGYF